MKKLIILIVSAMILVACDTQEKLRQRAAELCQYIPDHQLSEQARDFMTADFYAVLDTMFNLLPEYDVMDHEWLYFMVSGNGGTTPDFEVTAIELVDRTHAVATVAVRQKWEDGSFDENSGTTEHKMYMEQIDGRWLMSDFDGSKQECLSYLESFRMEQALRDAISDYLVKEVGVHYLQGEFCAPQMMIAYADVAEQVDSAQVWGDFWVFWYQLSGDTLKTVSGGNHSGCMTIKKKEGKPVVTAFEQTVDGAGNEASAKRIFGSHYDAYQCIHSDAAVRELVRREQLRDFVRRNGMSARCYQDFGWPAVEL
ncbi:MAG: hypothetical protein PUG15_09425 [Bacteroidales bacterium]|nr:hypothetical protein [Bacteroidales bacterium]